MAMVTVPGAPKNLYEEEQPVTQAPTAPAAPRAPAAVNYSQTGPTGGDYQPTDPPPYIAPIAPPSTPAPVPQQSNAAAGSGVSYDQVNGFYQKYLGRAASQDEATNWINGTYGASDLAGMERQIAGSDEAQRRAGSGGGGGDLRSRIDAALRAAGSSDDANYWYQKIGADPNGGGSAWAYWLDRINRGDGSQMGLPKFQDTGGYGGTDIFSDPATANFEKLLNQLIGRFNTPATPPDYQASIDQMKKYLERLNGPVYTPDQMDLMQTQAWNPMQQQHDAARQQLIARMGSQGIAQGSGIMEKALEDLDRQFQQAHTSQQANFSNQAIGLDRQNAAMAAGLAPQISNFEQAQTSWQDQRALQASGLAALIPQMAMQRLGAAQNSIQPLNPMSLLTMLQSFQNQGYNQSADYSSQIMQLLSQLFGMGN